MRLSHQPIPRARLLLASGVLHGLAVVVLATQLPRFHDAVQPAENIISVKLQPPSEATNTETDGANSLPIRINPVVPITVSTTLAGQAPDVSLEIESDVQTVSSRSRRSGWLASDSLTRLPAPIQADQLQQTLSTLQNEMVSAWQGTGDTSNSSGATSVAATEPAAAEPTKQSSFHGQFDLALLIDRQGRVADVVMMEADASALAFLQRVARHFRATAFSPGEVNGVAVNSRLNIRLVSEAPGSAGSQ